MIAVTICRYDRPQSGGRSGNDLQQSLSVRQDPAGQPAETDLLDGPYLNTAHNHYEYGSNRFSLVEQAPGATAVESIALEADTVSEVTGPLA